MFLQPSLHLWAHLIRVVSGGRDGSMKRRPLTELGSRITSNGKKTFISVCYVQ